MDDRICGTCRHFEGAEPGRGWCRNPRLYAANQSQPVSEFELSCATNQGDFWEASDDFIEGVPPSGPEPAAAVDRSLEYDEHEILSGGSQMRGSSADQPRSSDDAAYGPGDPTAPRAPRAPGGSGGSGRGGGSGERPPSYQTEERYWTDYLRIALPIAGLLLLLSVFWFWASSFIGGDEGTQTPVVAVNVTPQDQMSPTATLQDAVVLPTPTTAPAVKPTQPPAEPPPPPAEPTQSAAEPTQPSTTGVFQEGDLVIVNDNNVNMRSEPSTSGDVVDTLSQGTELRILNSTPTDAGGYSWRNVSDDAVGVEGWVAGDFLEK